MSPKRALLIKIPTSTRSMVGAVLKAIVRIWVSVISMDVRFEEMKDLWRSELHRVEEVIDARLKHIEGR
jgi:hypothetical protein